MKTPWLLLDVSYLAYRSFYAIGRLSYGSIPTEVVYGVLRDVLQLQELFNTKKVAFCFDYGKPFRKYDCPTYKKRRNEGKSEKELQAIAEVREQVRLLRKDYLPTIGFRNILFGKGYEADDVIAKVVVDRPHKQFIIVSSDKDLYQLLGPNVCIWNPATKAKLTEKWLRKTHGVGPQAWIDVKAMAGCKGDNVDGIPGIGEKLAAAFLTGKLNKGKKFESIVAGNHIWQANLGLVSLPYPGIGEFVLVHDEVTVDGWQTIIDRLGMHSLAGEVPGIPRRKSVKMKSSLGVWK